MLTESEPSRKGKQMRYQSKPSEIEAIQYGPEFRPGLVKEVAEFISGFELHDDGAITKYVQPSGDWDPPENAEVLIKAGKDGAQGWVPLPLGHWVVRQPGELSDHWPVDPDYFVAKYEPLDWFAGQTHAIRAWVDGDVVDNGELLKELRYWAKYWGPS